MSQQPGWRVGLGSALLLGSAAAAICSQLSLDDWASISQLGEWIQHGVIFWGAVGVGASLAVLRGPAARHRQDANGVPRREDGEGRTSGWWRGGEAGLLLLAGGGVLSLFAQFFLDGRASVSAAWDDTQHGLIFLGGVGVGASLVVLRRLSHATREDAGSEPHSLEPEADHRAARLSTAALLTLLAAGYLTGLSYLSLQGGVALPIPVSRVDVVHVASGIGATVFAFCLLLRRRRYLAAWSRWMNGLCAAAAALYVAVLATGIVILFPLPADLADGLSHVHLIAAVWAAEPALALLFELGRRGELRRLRPAGGLIRQGWDALSRRRRRAAAGALLGLAALVPAILIAIVAPRALSPAAQRGGNAGWQPIGPGVIIDTAILEPGNQALIAGGYGLYRVSLDGAWRPIGGFAGQDVLSLLRTPQGTVYVGAGLGLYRASSVAGPYRRLPLPMGSVHGVAVRGSEIWASVSFRGFYVSLDGGAHWRLVNAGLAYPDLAWALIDDHGTIFGSDPFGVYRFAGDHWDRVSGEAGVFSFTQGPNGQLFAAGEGGGVWRRDPNGRWIQSDAGLLSHNEGSFHGIHEFGVNFTGDGRAYGGSMLAGGDVSLDGGRSWSQQWPELSRDGAVYRILPDATSLVAATDQGLLLYRLPAAAPAATGWWALLIATTLAASLLAAALLLSRRRGSARLSAACTPSSPSPSSPSSWEPCSGGDPDSGPPGPGPAAATGARPTSMSTSDSTKPSGSAVPADRPARGARPSSVR